MTPDDPDRYDYLTDLFSVLSNETRLGILDVLWNERNDHGAQQSLTFSELRRRVGVATEEGFNYHLDKLAGTLITREFGSDDGYKLTPTGMFVAQAMNGGMFRSSVEVEGDPFPLDETCEFCGHSLVVTVRPPGHPRIFVECENCSQRYFSSPIHESPITEDNVEDVLQRAMERLRQQKAMDLRGICWLCAGRVNSEIDAHVERLSKIGSKETFQVFSSCERCGAEGWNTVAAHVRSHPEVVRFCMERGVDPTVGIELHSETSVAGADPFRVRVAIACEGDELHLTLDEQAEVVETSVVADPD